jgi:hypothetical protein
MPSRMQPAFCWREHKLEQILAHLPAMTNKQLARLAGLIYLVVVATGMFSLAYVPSKLLVWENPAETFQRITANVGLFRLGIVSSVLCYTSFLFLPLVLYKLLQSVDKTYAQWMVVLAVVSVPISFVNLLNKFAALSLVTGAEYLQVMPVEQLQVQMMFYLDLYNSGVLMVSVFWGLWLFPFGYLVYRSGFLPKTLGILLMAGCVGYLINFLGNTLSPAYAAAGVSSMVRLPATLGEIGTCLWLLVMGVKEKGIAGAA